MADEIQLDPNFFLPEGLKGVGYSTPLIEDADPEMREPDDDDSTIQLDDDDIDSIQIDDSEDIQESGELITPGPITVLSQTVRTASDGSSVVDVVIEVPDVPGASDYEVRLTR